MILYISKISSHKWGLLLISLFCLGLSCSNDPTPTIEKKNDPIIGRWNWVKEIYPRTLEEISPLTEGYTKMKYFKNDSIVEYYRNDSLTHVYPYEFRYIINNSMDPNSDSTRMLSIHDGIEAYYSITSDTLILDWSYIDGTTQYYKKEQ